MDRKKIIREVAREVNAMFDNADEKRRERNRRKRQRQQDKKRRK